MTPGEIQKIKDDLLDARTLAEHIYDHWISLMVTDRVPGMEGTNWRTIPDDAREDFVESLKSLVSDQFLKLEFEGINSRWHEVAIAAAIDEGPPVKKVCYLCASVVVEVPRSQVAICPDCKLGVLNE